MAAPSISIKGKNDDPLSPRSHISGRLPSSEAQSMVEVSGHMAIGPLGDDVNTPSPALINRLIDLLSDWQWSHVHERGAFKTRAEHLVRVVDEQRAKEAAQQGSKAA